MDNNLYKESMKLVVQRKGRSQTLELLDLMRDYSKEDHKTIQSIDGTIHLIDLVHMC